MNAFKTGDLPQTLTIPIPRRLDHVSDGLSYLTRKFLPSSAEGSSLRIALDPDLQVGAIQRFIGGTCPGIGRLAMCVR